MYIGIEFDGVCVKDNKPNVGEDIIGAEYVLNTLLKAGNKLILYTTRTGSELNMAVEWFKCKKIKLFGVNHNPEQKNYDGTSKVFCHLYIDAAGLGIPLIHEGTKPYVDWSKIATIFSDRDILTKYEAIAIEELIARSKEEKRRETNGTLLSNDIVDSLVYYKGFTANGTDYALYFNNKTDGTHFVRMEDDDFIEIFQVDSRLKLFKSNQGVSEEFGYLNSTDITGRTGNVVFFHRNIDGADRHHILGDYKTFDAYLDAELDLGRLIVAGTVVL